MGPAPVPGRRGTVRALLCGVLALVLFAVALPGSFRLIVLQTPRDLVFFYREIQPLRDPAGIETRRLEPDSTVVLPPEAGYAQDVELHMDLWIPQAESAPVALLLHGSSPRGRRLGFNWMLADRLRSAGWIVITPDARGYGDSPVPAERALPEAWHVHRDLERLADYARGLPLGSGVIVAIGHSFGGSQLVEAGFRTGPFEALALIGPGRYAPDHRPGYMSRVRFASDRRLARPVPLEVLTELRGLQYLPTLAEARTEASMHIPVLLMDGELEGEALIERLAAAAAALPPPVQHVTVPGSHHYCGVYQLPWLNRPVFVRPEIFERCALVLEAFLRRARVR